MTASPIPSRPFARRLARLLALAMAACPAPAAPGADAKPGPVDRGPADPRVQAIRVPSGFQVQVVAAEPALGDPAAMAFDDAGSLYVADWSRADRAFDSWDTLALPEGGTARVRRRRKATLDRVLRLRDLDGDGVFESSEVALDGAEMPSSILPYRNGLYLACVGRLERWTDEDGDGRFETRAVLADGFSAIGRRSLGGIALGADGWLYLAAGDADSHVVGPEGLRVELPRTGGIFRCRPDGSRMTLFARGFRGPGRGLAFNGTFNPFLVDDDPGDGSKFQGARLIHPAEDGDYGWRLRPGADGPMADFDRAAADGERPGRLPAVARVGRGSPSGAVACNSPALPGPLRDAIVVPDAARGVVRAFQVEPRGGSHALKGEATLMAGDDGRFRPVQAVVGADAALYFLDRRTPPDDAEAADPGGRGGRLYRLTWSGTDAAPSPARANNWQRIFAASTQQLVFQYMASPDFLEADRALRELVDRGPEARGWCVGYAGNVAAPLHARLLGIEGARQFWNDEVEATMVLLLGDAQPDVRRLAAQALAWEPKSANFRLVAKLAAHLDDPDGRVAREVALAIGRHAEPSPQKPAALLLRWLYAHPGADPVVRDGFLRALEKMGDLGVEEVALAVRTRRGDEREAAVALFSALRSAPAAEQLAGLVKIPDLTGTERLALVRQFPEIPAEVPVPTQGLADWALKHGEADPAVKVAVLDACRLAGNPASALVLALLDDDDESVRMAATRLAARSRPPGALARLSGRLKDSDRSEAEKLAIVRALRQAGPPAFAALDAAYLESDDLAFRRAALRSMAGADRARALPAMEAALSGRDPGLRAEAIRLLGEAPASALVLGKAYRGKALARADLPEVLAALRRHDAPEVRKLLAAIEDEAGREAASADPSEALARLRDGADPWAGLGVFFRDSAVRCSACHAVQGRGGSTATALTIGGRSPSAERIVDAILRHPRPKPGNEAARPRDARASAGPGFDPELIPAAGPAEGPTPRPDRASIELTPAEVADLAAFLASRPAQEALKHGPARIEKALAIGPFAPGLDKLRAPLDRAEPSKTLAGQDGSAARWSTLEAGSSGGMNLRGQLGSKPGKALLAVQVRSANDQAAALRFAVEGPARVYLNGAKVAEVAGREPSPDDPVLARPATGTPAPLPDLARLPLKAGWNLLIVVLDGDGSGDARVAMEVASPEPVETRTPPG